MTSEDKTQHDHVINKGKGAGGSNTNNNGLPYEKITDLSDRLTVIKESKYSQDIFFKDCEKK